MSHSDLLERQADKLRESEERYRALFNAIDSGFCVIEVLFDETEKAIDYRFVEVNPAFEQQTGLKNVEGRRVRELVPQHEEHWFQIYGEVAVTGKSVRFVNRAEGLRRWFDVCAFRIGEPESRKVAVLFTDITEKRRAETALHEREEQLRLIFDSATEPPANAFSRRRSPNVSVPNGTASGGVGNCSTVPVTIRDTPMATIPSASPMNR